MFHPEALHYHPMFVGFAPYASPNNSHFSRNRQGKVAELRQELNSGGKKDRNYSAKKIALKKIVANMTMSNNDMVALFPDVIECMNLPSLEIKKMCAYPDPSLPDYTRHRILWDSITDTVPIGAFSS